MKKKCLNEPKGITAITLILIVAVLVIIVIVVIAVLGNQKLKNVISDGDIVDPLIMEGTNIIIPSTPIKFEVDSNGLLINNNISIIGTDESIGYEMVIPVGFAPCKIDSDGNAVRIKDINTWQQEIAPNINKGIVVVDKNENEFVWIPIKKDTYQRNHIYSKQDVSKSAYSISSALPEDIEVPTSLTKPAIDDSEYTNIVESIEKNTIEKSNGFYISRYEIGKTKKVENEEIIPVSKKDILVWDEISFEDTIKVAKEMYKSGYVRSTLITGIQWDMVMNFIDGKLDNNGQIYNSRINNKENHTGILETSGKNVKDNICNIYDLEGNAWEYTAERSNYNIYSSYIYRGNSYATIGSASYRNIGDGTAIKGIGFRVVLYVI